MSIARETAVAIAGRIYGVPPDAAQRLATQLLVPAYQWVHGVHVGGGGGPVVVAVQGVQGAGKSTLAAALVDAFAATSALRTVALSLDDFYLTRAEQETVARGGNPLLQCRGNPGVRRPP